MTPQKLPQIVFKIKKLNKHDKLIPYGNKTLERTLFQLKFFLIN